MEIFRLFVELNFDFVNNLKNINIFYRTGSVGANIHVISKLIAKINAVLEGQNQLGEMFTKYTTKIS